MCNIIILAAGDIRNKLPFLEPRSKCPALLPVSTRPLLHYLLDFYKDYNNEINVFIYKEHEQELIDEINPKVFGYNVHSFEKTEGVVETLLLALYNLPVETDEVIVNLVTTIPTKYPSKNEVQISNEITSYPIASSIGFKDGIPFFISKDNNYFEVSYPFTGLFRYNKNKLLEASENLKKSELNDLLNIVKYLGKDNFNFEKTKWIDCGHEINYLSAKRDLIASRAFNKIEISFYDGTLQKKSENKQKLLQECNYIKMLPADIRIFYPRILEGFSEDVPQSLGCYKMEYYGYPNITEYLLYWELNEGHWHRLFSKFFHILNKFQKNKFSIGFNTFLDFYWEKLINRIDEFSKQITDNKFKSFFFNQIIFVNGQKCRPFEEIKEKIKEKIISLYNENDFCIMHGDFTFNNILYDFQSGIVRLIDQRGSFGKNAIGIYGDQKYDLAKLAHSTIGHYDYIVNDLYNFSFEGHNIQYTFHLRDNSKILEQLTEKIIIELGFQKDDIYFIMGLLFLSMTPLHYDSLDRQKLMYMHGLRIINETLNNNYENLH